MSLSRAIMWIVILAALVIGAGAYWFFTREFKGQAAETVNIAHTEALTGSSLGLVGYWTFDGNDVKWSDTTTEIKDTSGNAKHGDAQGSLTTTSATSGKTGQALSFNGTSDLVSLGNVYNGVKTVAFWAKPNSATQPFIDLNGTATINVTSGTAAANSFTSPTIYVDGVATSTFPDTGWHHVAVTTGTGINASAVNLGKISSSYFGGVLDDVRFYSTALSATQVTDLYRASSAKEIDNANHREALTNGLVGYWTMDGRDIKWSDTTTEIKDISGNGNHGDAVGLTTTSAVRGKLGQALSFNGGSDKVSVGNPSVLNEITTKTICAWVYPTLPTNDDSAIVAKQLGGGWRFIVLDDAGAVSLGFIEYYSPGTDGSWKTLSGSIEKDEWQHVCVSYNNASTSNVPTFYINGNAQSLITIYSPSGTRLADTDYLLTIGNNESDIRLFEGSLDDIRMYNRLLSLAEVSSLYSLGK